MKPIDAAAGRRRAAAPDRLIVELGRGLHHALARFGRKARAVGVVEDERHRRLRDARFVGDVDHRRPARRRRPPGVRAFLRRLAPASAILLALVLPHSALTVGLQNIIIAVTN